MYVCPCDMSPVSIKLMKEQDTTGKGDDDGRVNTLRHKTRTPDQVRTEHANQHVRGRHTAASHDTNVKNEQPTQDGARGLELEFNIKLPTFGTQNFDKGPGRPTG